MVKVMGMLTLETVPGLNRHCRNALVAALSRMGLPVLVRDGTASDVAASCVHLGDDHSTTSDVPRARFVGILGTRRIQGERFCSRHRHRPRSFDRRKFLRVLRLPRWRCSFFDKFRLNVRRRRRLWDGNIFWRRSGLGWR